MSLLLLGVWTLELRIMLLNEFIVVNMNYQRMIFETFAAHQVEGRNMDITKVRTQHQHMQYASKKGRDVRMTYAGSMSTSVANKQRRIVWAKLLP